MTLHDDFASPEEDGCAVFEAPPGDRFAAVHVPALDGTHQMGVALQGPFCQFFANLH